VQSSGQPLKRQIHVFIQSFASRVADIDLRTAAAGRQILPGRLTLRASSHHL
jgi:hypothetical protein